MATAYRAMPPLVEQIPPNKQCFQEKYARCGVVYLLATPWGRITDPVGKEYRPYGVTFTDPVGKEYRPYGVTLPTVSG